MFVCINYWDCDFVGHFVIEIVGKDVCSFLWTLGCWVHGVAGVCVLRIRTYM